jgi:hypothetical protein
MYAKRYAPFCHFTHVGRSAMTTTPDITELTFYDDTSAKEVAFLHFRRTAGWLAVDIGPDTPNAGVWINPMTRELAVYSAGSARIEAFRTDAQINERFLDFAVTSFNDTGTFPTVDVAGDATMIARLTEIGLQAAIKR